MDQGEEARERWSLAAALVFVVVTGVLAFGVVQRKKDADEQRHLAEQRLQEAVNVANRLLLTIRTLKTVAGAAKARQELLAEANDLLQKLRASGAEDDASVLWSQMIQHEERGNLSMTHGDLETARREYEASLEIARSLVEADLDDARAQRELSVRYSKLGDVASRAGDLSAARDLFQQSLEIAKALAAADPDNAEARKDVLLSHGKLMILGLQSSDDSAFRQHIAEAVRILDEFESEGLFTEDAQIRQIRGIVAELSQR